MKQIVAFFLAVGLSFFLFVLMNSFINVDAKAFEPSPASVISVTFDPEDTEITRTSRASKKTPKLELVREEPIKQKTLSKPTKTKPMKVALGVGTTEGFEVSYRPAINPNSVAFDDIGGSGESGLMPKVRIEPLYPDKAARKGVEGFVTMTFDINAEGVPVNIKIVDSNPKGYFEKSAKKALRKWKYYPKQEAGKSVLVMNKSVTLAFKLEGKS